MTTPIRGLNSGTPTHADLSRRAFVRAGLALAAASATAAAAAPRQPAAPATPATPSPNTKRTLRKAVMIGMIAGPGEKPTLADKFKLARDCGFEGLEIDWPAPIELDALAEAQDKSGLKIHGVVNSVHWSLHLNSPDAKVRAEAIIALESCVNAAATLKASSILLVPGVVNASMSYADCYTLSQQSIREVLPMAQAKGITIAVENVWNGFLLSPLEAAKYVDDLASPAAAFHFDIGNIINFGWPEHWIDTLGARIAKLHIKDFSRKKRDNEGLWKGFDVELGEGDAGWDRTMKALDRVGYSTDPRGLWATAEVRGGNEERLKQISTQMDALFAKGM
jgi:hexulose-6-phosphate isomerase